MRPLLVRAVSIDGILENRGHMRSLAAEAHREITLRYHVTLFDLHERRRLAGAARRVLAMRKGPRGDRRRTGAPT